MITRLSAILGLLTLVQASSDDSELALMKLMEERNLEFSDIPPEIVNGLLELA